jgi:hypothetical protein
MDFIKSFKWVDYFFLVFTEPRKLMSSMMKGEPAAFPFSFSGIMFFALSLLVSGALVSRQTHFFYDKLSYGLILVGLALFLKLVLYGCLLDLIFQFMGYPGNIKNIVTMLNFSLFTWVLLVPSVFIFKVVNFAPVFFHALFIMALCIWSVLIIIQGVSELHGLSLSRSALVVLCPLGLVIAFIILSTVLAAVLVAKYVPYISL